MLILFISNSTVKVISQGSRSQEKRNTAKVVGATSSEYFLVIYLYDLDVTHTSYMMTHDDTSPRNTSQALRALRRQSTAINFAVRRTRLCVAESLLCRRVSRIDERLLQIIRRPRLARRSVEVQEAQLDRLSGGRDQQPRGVGRTTH